MELNGALSNRRVQAEVSGVADVAIAARNRGSGVFTAPSTGFPPVLETVTRVLESAREPMRPRDIHLAAQEMTGTPLRWGSVKGALSAYTVGGDRRFRRVGYGRYEIRRPAVK